MVVNTKRLPSIYSFRLLITALLLFIGSTSFAEIRIVGTLGPCGNDFGGVISVEASGNAGPFTIRLIDGVPARVRPLLTQLNKVYPCPTND